MIIEDESGKEVIYQTEKDPPVVHGRPQRDRPDPNGAPPLGKDPKHEDGVWSGRLKKGKKPWHDIDHADDYTYTVTVYQPPENAGDQASLHDSRGGIADNRRVRIGWQNGEFKILLGNERI